MSKKVVHYSGVKLVKRKRTKRKKFGVFLFCVLCVGGVVLFATGVPDALKISSFSFLFKSETNVVNAHSYYAVLMGEYGSESEAQAVASGASVVGAGAYVWNTDGKFLVVGNVYKNKADAETVAKNISGNNYNVSVYEIKYSKLKVDLNNLSSEQELEFVNAINFLDDMFLKVYNYSVKFDKSEIVATVVSSELNTLKSEIKVWASKLDSINSFVPTSFGLSIKNTFVALATEFDSCVLKVINGASVSKDLKYLTTSVAVRKFNLFNNLSGV